MTVYTLLAGSTYEYLTFHSGATQLLYDGALWWAFYTKSASDINVWWQHTSNDPGGWSAEDYYPSYAGQPIKSLAVCYDSSGRVVTAYYQRGTKFLISGTSLSLEYDNSTGALNEIGSVAVDYAASMWGYSSAGYVGVYLAYSRGLYIGAASLCTLGLGYDQTTDWTKNFGFLQDRPGGYSGSNSSIVVAGYTDIYGEHCLSWAAGVFVSRGFFVIDGDAADVTLNCGYTFNGYPRVVFSYKGALYHKEYDAVNTVWNDVAAVPSWPSGGFAADSELGVYTDDTNVWLFGIRADGSVAYTKYNGSSWGGWGQAVAANGNTRKRIQVSRQIADTSFGLLWTETVSGNYDLKAAIGTLSSYRTEGPLPMALAGLS